jgi:uncharacterized protein
MLPDRSSHRKRVRELKFHLARNEGRNAITAYGDGYVDVNQQRFERSLVVLPDRLIPEWQTGVPPGAASLGLLAALDAELVLIGTGRSLQFPPAEALRPLIEARLGFEIMDTQAACRTYNILMAENRRVAAALIL